MEPGHSAIKLTYADYERLPDDGLRHEIIGGEHYVTASPTTRHQRLSRELLYLFVHYLKAHPIGEVLAAPFDVVLSDADIVVPDLICLSESQAHLLTAKNLPGVPDLVVEILSPTTRPRDEWLKLELYERVGVGEYWLVDPECDEVIVYRRRGAFGFEAPIRYQKHERVTTPLLPGLDLPLDRILV